MPLLEIKNLSKNYENKPILEDINLSIEKGTIMGIIGPTGCGKTTLLRIIDLLERPSSGKIIFDGLDTSKSKKDKMEIRRRIGMVFQNPVVFNGTVFDNIHYGLNIRGQNKESSRHKILELLKSLGLEGYEDRDASTLSGGETQRISLARALVTQPDILLLDEPTANLDPVSTEKIESIIEDLRKKRHTTMIIATHNLMQGQRLSDEIAILNKKIHQIGKPEEVFTRPKNNFVADFVGMKNVIRGKAKKAGQDLTLIDLGGIDIYSSTPLEGGVYASIRPEDITVSNREVRTSALNEFKGTVREIKDIGTLINLKVDLDEIFTVYMTKKSFLDLKITIGSQVWLQFKASAVHVFK